MEPYRLEFRAAVRQGKVALPMGVEPMFRP
jgi:hypothetical protein